MLHFDNHKMRHTITWSNFGLDYSSVSLLTQEYIKNLSHLRQTLMFSSEKIGNFGLLRLEKISFNKLSILPTGYKDS